MDVSWNYQSNWLLSVDLDLAINKTDHEGDHVIKDVHVIIRGYHKYYKGEFVIVRFDDELIFYNIVDLKILMIYTLYRVYHIRWSFLLMD